MFPSIQGVVDQLVVLVSILSMSCVFMACVEV